MTPVRRVSGVGDTVKSAGRTGLLEAAGAGAPHGQLYHVSYGSRDNLQVIDVFDSSESFESFGRTLAPILEEMGITAVPEVHDAYKIMKG